MYECIMGCGNPQLPEKHKQGNTGLCAEHAEHLDDYSDSDAKCSEKILVY